MEELKKTNSTNQKIILQRRIRKVARTIQRFAPYVISAGAITGSLMLLGSNPFICDEHKQYANIMTERDSKGNVRYIKQYDSFENAKSTFHYYSKWQLENTDLYSRNEQIFSIDLETYNNIIGLSDLNDINIKDILGKPIGEYKETKNNLSEEEKQQQAGFKIVTYDKDKNDFIIVKESIIDNTFDISLELILLLLATLTVFFYRDKLSSFDYRRSINNIMSGYQTLSTDELICELKRKKEEYEELKKKINGDEKRLTLIK